MKKIKWIVGALLLTAMLGGCNKKNSAEEIFEISHERFCYVGTEGVNRIAVDEDGLLYTVTAIMPEYDDFILAEDYVFQPVTQLICIYDLDGNCIEQVDMKLGAGSVQEMMIQDGIMYCTINSEDSKPVLYAVDVDTWEITEVVVLSGYTSIFNLVGIGEYIYVCGTYKQDEVKEYQLHPDVLTYSYKGERISRVKLNTENPKVEFMNIEFPIAICGLNEESILIYRYTEDNGFGFLEYNHEKGVLSESGWKNTTSQLLNFGDCGAGYLFTREGNLYYGTVDGAEAQILPERISIADAVVYKKGFAFFMNNGEERRVERLCVTDVVHENVNIKLLMHDDTMDKPYGCGYRMDKIVLSSEQFALKVLAQDKDYDVFLLSTNQSCSYNLKENGVFYSLNEVEGVQEYLDACFPYVKELATNEDGDIWMFPVALAIPGIVYNKEYCEENSVDFNSMDFYDFLTFTKKMEAEQPLMTSISSLLVYEEFFGSYLKSYDTFDTEAFRNYLEMMLQIYNEQGEWLADIGLLSNMTSENIPDFYYMFERYLYRHLLNEQKLGNSDAVGVMGVPGITDGTGNVGTITFLAVNPQSDNLEDSLAYISSLAKYMLETENSFILADESTYSDTPYMRDLYQVYANGAVNFAMESEIYWEPFSEYLGGVSELEDVIGEMERRRKIYIGE